MSEILNPWDRLEQVEKLHFRTRGPHNQPEVGHGRVFGGSLVAACVHCAYHTIPAGFHLNGLHSYFIRAGDGFKPVDYVVQVVRDGRTFVFRDVRAYQNDALIYHCQMTFREFPNKTSFDHTQLPSVPEPEQVPVREHFLDELLNEAKAVNYDQQVLSDAVARCAVPYIRMHPVGGRDYLLGPTRPQSVHYMWIKWNGGENNANDRQFRATALSCISDYAASIAGALYFYNVTFKVMTSLDQNVFVHCVESDMPIQGIVVNVHQESESRAVYQVFYLDPERGPQLATRTGPMRYGAAVEGQVEPHGLVIEKVDRDVLTSLTRDLCLEPLEDADCFPYRLCAHDPLLGVVLVPSGTAGSTITITGSCIPGNIRVVNIETNSDDTPQKENVQPTVARRRYQPNVQLDNRELCRLRHGRQRRPYWNPDRTGKLTLPLINYAVKGQYKTTKVLIVAVHEGCLICLSHPALEWGFYRDEGQSVVLQRGAVLDCRVQTSDELPAPYRFVIIHCSTLLGEWRTQLTVEGNPTCDSVTFSFQMYLCNRNVVFEGTDKARFAFGPISFDENSLDFISKHPNFIFKVQMVNLEAQWRAVPGSFRVLSTNKN